MSTSFFQDMLGSIAERGRALIDRSPARPGARTRPRPPETLESLARELLSGRGEASGVALARRLLDRYAAETMAVRIDFFRLLARDMDPNPDAMRGAWEAYERQDSPAHLRRLLEVVEPPRQELFRRLNLAPGGTAALVGMRADLLLHGGREASLRKVDDDFAHLFGSWFNRGFLMLRRIDWSTPADILERIIRYEAVHEIQGWDDLRRRVQPADRRCFGFFHPSLADEPLIFVEVALTREIPGTIGELLAEERGVLPAGEATTAVFYSISNCQPGLRGVSFGSFLIKQVVEELKRELPALATFVTLSPVPGFSAWLARQAEAPSFDPGWHQDPATEPRVRAQFLQFAARYLLTAKDPGGKPLDPVARFHLGNGARLERINLLGDPSAKGMREAHGLMVNYLYDLRFIEANHEAFANAGTVVSADAVRRHLPAVQPAPESVA